MRAGPMLIKSTVGSDLDTFGDKIAFVDRYDGFVTQENGPTR